MAEGQRGIEELLADKIGLDPVSIGSTLISRAAHRRMHELDVNDPSAYEQLLRQSESELQALIDQVVVSESWFFRDVQPFQWLQEHVRARWLADLLRAPVRALSLGCATGEEPYSIAMTLLDLGLPARRFQIAAVDISARRLTEAHAGVYSANSFRGADLGYRERYFRECHQGYELDAKVRSTVTFHHANVLNAGCLARSTAYDVVFCRNLLIYLNTRARACVISAIDRLLADDGLLFIGHADRLELGDTGPRFTAVGATGVFAYQRSDAALASQPRLQLEPPPVTLGLTGPQAVAGSKVSSPPPSLPRASPPVPALATATSIGTETSLPLLDRAAELANRGQFDQALAACEQHLRQKGLTAPTYFLMGMICQAAGKGPRAEEYLHKALYLDPRHAEALLALALLAERRGDNNAAAGFRRRAERTVVMMRKKVN
jgi:chemotaxis protein methyltransferase WspC